MPTCAVPSAPAPKGRGAQTNRSGRFEPSAVEAFDDGWCDDDAPVAQLKTSLTAERARTIISRIDSPDVGFDRSINTYRGCEHGCGQPYITHRIS